MSGGIPKGQPISQRARPVSSAGCLAVFFGIFFLIGAGVFVAMFVRPALKILQARDWPAIPCTILESEVRRHSGGKGGSTYSVEVRFAYEFHGRHYEADRYQFMTGASSGYRSKARIVGALPPDHQTVCYVNPADPAEAVLNRGFTPDFWFALIPLGFMAFGGIAAWATLRKGRRSADRRVASRDAWAGTPQSALGIGFVPLPGTDEAPVTLRPKTSPLVKLLGALLLALFWNGIVSVFLVQVVKMWWAGQGGFLKWFLTLFLLPFVAVGLAIIGGVFHALLGLMNPRPWVTLSRRSVPLGGSLQVSWELAGSLDRIREFTLELEGREEATFRRGTDTHTDKAVFVRIEIARLSDRMEMRSGSAGVTIPADAMHSLNAEHNKIVWAIRLKADMPKWPDLEEEFPLAVTPLPHHLPSAP